MASGTIDIKALNWLKGEIGDTLNNIRQALEVYVDKQEGAKLDYIVANLHQITGTLHIVELFSPALLAEEMEHLARALKNGQVKQPQDAFETLTRGILQLPAYLEHLRLGHHDQPAVLLPLLNDLRSAHGQPLLSESSLFSPDLNVYPPAKAASKAKPGEERAQWKKLRTLYQTSLLGWFRDPAAKKHLKKLSFVLAQLDGSCASDDVRQLWWIASGLTEALESGGVPNSVAVKSLLGQLDRQMKKLVDKGEAQIQRDRPTELLKNLLFYVAQSKSGGVRVQELKKEFNLADLLPDANDLSKAQSDLLGASAGVMDNVAAALKEDLLSMKDTIDLFVRAKDHPLAELEPVANKMRTIGDTLGILGMGRMRKAVKDQEAILRDILSGMRPLTDDAVMNVASTLLYVESSLTDLNRGDTEMPALAENLVGSALPDNEYRALVTHTTGEARTVLGKLKEAVVAFVASPTTLDPLEPVPSLAHDIHGALSILGFTSAANLVQHVGNYVKNEILGRKTDISQERLDSLADAITGVEYFLESVDDDPIGANNSLVLARLALRNLGLDVPEISTARASATEAELVPPPPETLDLDLSAPEVTAAVPPPAGTAKPAPAAPATKPERLEVDEEVREIFLEEATEETQSIQTNLAAWTKNVEDIEALRTLRRSFHTIKGSGRIVGAMEIGEFAWAVENMLNRVLDRTIETTPGVFGVLETASELLPKLVDELRAGTSGGVVIQPLIDRAQRLARGEPDIAASTPSAPEIVTPEPVVETAPDFVSEVAPPVEAEVPELAEDFTGADVPVVTPENAPVVETVQDTVSGRVAEPASDSQMLDPVLAEIFTNEARVHLGTLTEYFDQCDQSTEPCLITEGVIRALHTLNGSSHLTNIAVIADLADALEKLAKLMYENRSPISTETRDVLRDSVTLIRDAVTHIHDIAGFLPGQQDLLQRIRSLHNSQSKMQGERLSSAQSEISTATAKPIDAELVDVFLLEASDAIGKNLATLDLWTALPEQRDYPDEIRRRLGTLAGGARISNLDPVANVCSAAARLAGLALDATGNSTGDVIQALREAHGWLTDALDRIKGHSGLNSGNDLIELLETYTSALDSLRPAAKPAAAPGHGPDTATEPVTTAGKESGGDDELTAIFLDEAAEILGRVDGIVQRWSDALDDRAVIEDLQRELHTLKGGARMARIEDIGNVAHQVETVLTRIVEGTLSSSRNVYDAAQSALDWIAHSVDAVRNHLPFAEHGEIMERLAQVGTEPVVSAEVEPESSPEMAETVEPDETAQVIPFRRPEPEPVADEPTIALDVDDDLVDVFLEEGAEILHSIDALIARWSKDAGNKTTIEELQRALHTIKGGARMARVTPVGDLSHSIENILESIGQGRIAANTRLIELMHTAYDWLTTALERVRARTPLSDPAALIAKIEHAVGLRETAPDVVEAKPAVAAETAPDFKPEAVEAHVDNSALAEMMQTRNAPATAAPAAAAEAEAFLGEAKAKQAAAGEQVRVALALLDALVNNAGEVSIYRSRIELQMNSVRYNLVELTATVNRLREQLRKFEIEAEAQMLFRYEKSGGNDTEEFDPLELDRFSNMQQLSRSLVETVGDLTSVQKMLDNLTRESEILLLQQSRVTSSLQDGLMRTRLVPFSSVVPRLRRIVRQTAKELDKQVDLEVLGAEGEMDRSVLNRLTPALEHMLRNSVDHGIEAPRQRAKAGKPEAGTVALKFWREGSEIALSISDDGAGLNLAAIRKKAIERGLMDKKSDLSDNEVMQFVLESGFSTAKKVTQISGRGVGMDVVNNEIKQLNGSLQLASTAGKGSTFIVRLPLTVSVNQALMVSAGEQIYAIPLSSIDGVVRVTRDELQGMYESEAGHYDYAGFTYRFFHLGRMLNLSQAQLPDASVKTPLILARAGDHRVALWVDAIVSRQEVVIKSVGPMVSTVAGISGATIMGDGGVALILDLSSLLRSGIAHHARRDEQAPVEAAPVAARVKTVMVVDDSITVRRVTERLLKRHEFETITAKDGMDALEKLQEHIPDVMLLDIEMPRMDGYELATAMRNDTRLKGIPIIMITSRTGDKHRERAMAIGVNMYMGKPYQENELLENINTLLNPSGQ